MIGLMLGFVYLWFRLGPRRCPNCGKLAWGHFGKPWGLVECSSAAKFAATSFKVDAGWEDNQGLEFPLMTNMRRLRTGGFLAGRDNDPLHRSLSWTS